MPSAPGQNHTVGRYEAHSLAVRRNRQWHEQEISLIKAPPFLCSLATKIYESKINKCMHTGLSLRAGGRGFFPATMSVAPATFIGKQKKNRTKQNP